MAPELTTHEVARGRPEWLPGEAPAAAMARPVDAEEVRPLEELDDATAVREFAAWADAHGAVEPRALHGFLAALDLRLREALGNLYRSDRTWFGSPDAAPPFHGFSFEVEAGGRVSRRFVGFAREGTALDLRLAAPWEPEEPVARFCAFPLAAGPIARVLAILA